LSKPTTYRLNRLIETGLEIGDREPTSDELGYMHAVLSQVGLPRKRHQGTRFERRSGGASLLVRSGELWDGRDWVEQPIPYGPKPRVMMADLFNYALKHQTLEIDLGDSVTEYLRRLGWTAQGGARGPLTMFKNQAKALAACHMSLGVHYGGRAHTVQGQPIEEFEAWVEDRGHQRTLWPGSLKLSARFFESLQRFAVPLDMRAVHVLADSALALDIYTALAHRLHRLKAPTVVYWSAWREQFGQEYANPKDFKKRFLEQLKQVLVVYPDAKVQVVQGGLALVPSRPPVAPRLVAVGR
jgi:hypothetical protein